MVNSAEKAQSNENGSDALRCPNCDKEVDDKANYCGFCTWDLRETLDWDKTIKKFMESAKGKKETEELYSIIANKLREDRKDFHEFFKKNPLPHPTFPNELLSYYEMGFFFGFAAGMVEERKKANEKKEKAKPPREESSIVKILKEMAKKGEIRNKKIKKMIERL